MVLRFDTSTRFGRACARMAARAARADGTTAEAAGLGGAAAGAAAGVVVGVAFGAAAAAGGLMTNRFKVSAGKITSGGRVILPVPLYDRLPALVKTGLWGAAAALSAAAGAGDLVPFYESAQAATQQGPLVAGLLAGTGARAAKNGLIAGGLAVLAYATMGLHLGAIAARAPFAAGDSR